MFYDQGVSTLNISAANDLGDTALHMASRWGFGEYNAVVLLRVVPFLFTVNCWKRSP